MKSRTLITLLPLLFSFYANAEEVKPVISNLQEGSVYKTKDNEYKLVNKKNETLSQFKLSQKKDCKTMFEQIKTDPLFVDIKQIKDNQIFANEKNSKTKHLFYCSEDVLVDIQIP